MFRYLIVALAAMVFTACGGSNTSEPQLLGPVDATDQALLAEHYFNDLQNYTYTDLTSVPSEGRAEYLGVIEGRISELPAFAGAFTANLGIGIDFSSQELVEWARAEGFNFSSGNAALDTIALSESSFRRDGDPEIDHTLAIGLNGDLLVAGDDNLQVNLQLEGDFFGPDTEFVAGLVLGRASLGNQTGRITGRFAATN